MLDAHKVLQTYCTLIVSVHSFCCSVLALLPAVLIFLWVYIKMLFISYLHILGKKYASMLSS